MRHRVLIMLLVACLATPADACINQVATDRDGRQIHYDQSLGDELISALAARPATRPEHIRRVVDAARREPDFRTRTALAVLLIEQGKPMPAIELLLALERQHPGRYETAGNLGTALELAGKDRSALRWIRIGIRRNPDSHYSTEWLHARILEAKIAAAGGKPLPASILGVDFGDAPMPVLPQRRPPGNDGKPVSLPDLDKALHFQLTERIRLVPAPDAVVANLLRDWAALNLAGGPAESSEALYRFADKWGAPQDALTVARHARAKAALARKAHDPDAPGTCEICW